MRIHLLLALSLCTILVGCADETVPVAMDPNAPPTGPLTALAECEEPPDAEPFDPVEGAELHPEAVVDSVTPQGPLTSMTAYVPVTPVNIRLWYENRDDLEIIIIEDEVFEAELLVSNGEHRTYVKASAICQTGSTMVATVAEELAAAELPVPAGAVDALPTD